MDPISGSFTTSNVNLELGHLSSAGITRFAGRTRPFVILRNPV